MVSLTEKPCRFTLAGLFSFRRRISHERDGSINSRRIGSFLIKLPL